MAGETVDENYQQRLTDEGFAPISSSDNSDWSDGVLDSRERDFLIDSSRMQEEMENQNVDRIPGYLSNEVYEPVKKDKLEVKKGIDDNSKKDIMDISLNEIISNTTECLNDFEPEFLSMLYKVDLKYGYSNDENGMITNIKRYFIAFIFYLNDKNYILYIGITLLIISIILYFINIIRR